MWNFILYAFHSLTNLLTNFRSNCQTVFICSPNEYPHTILSSAANKKYLHILCCNEKSAERSFSIGSIKLSLRNYLKQIKVVYLVFFLKCVQIVHHLCIMNLKRGLSTSCPFCRVVNRREHTTQLYLIQQTLVHINIHESTQSGKNDWTFYRLYCTHYRNMCKHGWTRIHHLPHNVS